MTHEARDVKLNKKSVHPPTKRYGFSTEANIGELVNIREQHRDLGRLA